MQGRIGHRMSREHEGAQGTRQEAKMTTKAGPELSSQQHQNCANKSQGGAMAVAGWRAQQAKQEESGRHHKTIGVAGITAGQGNGAADDMIEEGLEGTAKDETR